MKERLVLFSLSKKKKSLAWLVILIIILFSSHSLTEVRISQSESVSLLHND